MPDSAIASGATIIKTTAKFQEANEPNRQRPIIRIDGMPMVYQEQNGSLEAVELPNTIRASIDSGKDNPFKPDGEIYKLADPIVDFYKHGPNQSRAQSPSDSLLLIDGQDKSKLGGQSDTQGHSEAARFWFGRKKRKDNKNEAAKGRQETTKKSFDEDYNRLEKSRTDAIYQEERSDSCCRRWFCICCCFCYCCGLCKRNRGLQIVTCNTPDDDKQSPTGVKTSPVSGQNGHNSPSLAHETQLKLPATTNNDAKVELGQQKNASIELGDSDKKHSKLLALNEETDEPNELIKNGTKST